MDCHGAGGDWSFNSLIPDALDPRCEFVVQTSGPSTRRCSSRAATPRCSSASTPAPAPSAACSRTRSARPSWRNLRFNGTLVGEVGINAALCGTWGTPVALVTGDDVVCDEATELLGPGLKTLAVKRGLGRFSARHLSPARARELLEAAARDALADTHERPGLRPRGALHDRGRARHARPRRRATATAPA